MVSTARGIMSSFTKPLVVKKRKDNLWELYTEFEYHVGAEGSGNVINVPVGFITDFASVPRIFWIFYPPDGPWTAASIIHDYLYNIQDRSRATADAIFLEAMQVLGVPWIRRRIIYRAVRLFGWIPWNNRARKKKKQQKEKK